MSDIFISYKREEQPVARKLADALGAQGWSVWWDPKLRAGEHFDDVIETALKEAKCVLVMWSKLSVESPYVKAEASYALKQQKLIPIAIEEVDPPFRFAVLHTGQLLDWNGFASSQDFKKLVDDIAGVIGPSPAKIEHKERKKAETASKRKSALEKKQRAEEEKKRNPVEREVRPRDVEHQDERKRADRRKYLTIGLITGIVVLVITAALFGRQLAGSDVTLRLPFVDGQTKCFAVAKGFVGTVIIRGLGGHQSKLFKVSSDGNSQFSPPAGFLIVDAVPDASMANVTLQDWCEAAPNAWKVVGLPQAHDGNNEIIVQLTGVDLE